MITGTQIFTSFFVFLFGVIIGSFLNVVALRFNTGFSLQGRSRCFSCGKTLYWYELIPVASFILQKGKCRGCHSKISWQYPLVEILTGFIFVGIFYKVFSFDFFISFFSTNYLPASVSLWQAGLLLTTYYLIIFSLLIIISIYDLKHKIIPNGLVYAFIALSFLHVFFPSFFSSLFFELSTFNFLPAMPSASLWQAGQLSTFLAGPILFMFFFLLWFLSSGRWMGFGDAKLALGIGWFLGLSSGLTALCIAFYTGALVGVAALIFQWLKERSKKQHYSLNRGGDHLTMKSEIPFGPFLIFGLMLVFFFQIDFFQFVLFSF